MDYRDPLRALFPGVQGAVLSTLAATTRPLTLRQLADLADSNPSQVSKHVDRLTRLGVVCRERIGPADQISLCNSAAADLFRAIAHLHSATLIQMRELAAQMDPTPLNVTVFGSFARADARPDSDIDIVLVRPTAVTDDDAWIEAVGAFTDAVWETTRHPVADIHLDEAELTEALDRPLWKEVLLDGITLAGTPLEELRPQ